MNSSKPRTITKLVVPKRKNKKNDNSRMNRMDFAQCVLHPFDGPNHLLSTVPDGDASNRLLIDHSSYTDFTINSGGSIALRVMPTLPFNCLYQAGSGTVLTVTDPILGSLTGTAGSTFNNSWTPCCSINQHFTSMQTSSLFLSIPGAYSQSRCRLISLAWRIIYTGTVAHGNGMLTMRDYPITLDEVLVLPTSGLSQSNQFNNSSSLNSGPVAVAMVDFPAFAGGSDVGKTVFDRLDHNPWGIVKRNSRIYSWDSFFEQPYALIGSNNTKAALSNSVATPIQSLLSETTTKAKIGINYLSKDFNTTEILLTGVSQNISFRIEVKACFEYMVLPSSPVYALTKTPAKSNLAEINAVQEKQASLQPAFSNGTVITNPSINKTGDTNKVNTVAINKIATQAVKNAEQSFFNKIMKYFPTTNKPITKPRY